jgi:hypothetical protein
MAARVSERGDAMTENNATRRAAPKIKTPTFDRLIEDSRRSFALAIDQHDWQTALESAFSGLLWRSVRLALRLNIVPASFDPKVSWKVTAIQLLKICKDALDRQPERGSEEPDYRVEVVLDVLAALMDVAAALEAGKYKTADGALQLTIISANLGRCEMMLGFAEEGFWEQVYEWRRRQGGKPKGTGLALWKQRAAPEVQRWIEEAFQATGKVKIADLETKLQDWLDAQNTSRSRDAVKTAIRQMRESGAITLPLKRRKR